MEGMGKEGLTVLVLVVPAANLKLFAVLFLLKTFKVLAPILSLLADIASLFRLTHNMWQM